MKKRSNSTRSWRISSPRRSRIRVGGGAGAGAWRAAAARRAAAVAGACGLESGLEMGALDSRRLIPSVDRLLGDPRIASLFPLYGRAQVSAQARREVEAARARLAAEPPPSREEALAAVAALPERLAANLEERLGGGLRRALNATGIFLHTNLGRAPLPQSVARALPPLLDAYCDLEFELDDGRRGDRNRRLERLLTAATGAEAALVVNNNAAALVLALAVLARDREVVVSRGELVEIGGSFRIPEILAAAGALLVEVGSTNRTRLADYERAIGPETALLLKVFPSNFRVVGFTASVAPAELVELGRRRGLPLLVDEGSGLLRPHPAPALAGHPSLSELVAAGCDLACGSGDKLLGGPQAGLLVGRAEVVARCRKHPLYRALRPDRGGIAALEGVLKLHLAGAPLPLDRLWPEPAAHRRRLESAAAAVGAEIVPAEAFLGGGSAPEAPLPGEALALPGDDTLLRRLRTGEPPVVGYLRGGRLLLDLRTVDPENDPLLVAAVRAALAG
ncbi:MAG TPA: L-seryl-tRNA(Sec) selenium transferase [Thermoanaerobaculia bacterium]|nr:L-seryl-tRNA(Sec) selenium transferase [Thermoanaerobaculia bacterium]